MSQPTNILINHKEKKYFVWREENVKKIKKYSRIKNRHFYFENALGQSFPHTSGSVWCVENSDLTGSTNQNARYWYGNAEKYFFATLHNWVYLVYSEREVWLAKSACQHLKGPWILSPSISLASYGVVSGDEKWWELMRSKEWQGMWRNG